jgi:SAM-dependent methyltransferase
MMPRSSNDKRSDSLPHNAGAGTSCCGRLIQVSDAYHDQEAVSRLLASQRTYYDMRAPDHADVTSPSDRKCRGDMDSETAARLLAELAPEGDVLELACGSGSFTRELARHARSVTCVDGSPRMLELNRQALADPRVNYICADLFDWTTTEQFDVVFFGFWLSHVPPTHFDRFWALVRSCLRPGGRALFIDEDARGAGNEEHLTDEGLPTARRTLRDGRSFDIVKIFWKPDKLAARLQRAGWTADVRSAGDTFLYGVARPA